MGFAHRNLLDRAGYKLKRDENRVPESFARSGVVVVPGDRRVCRDIVAKNQPPKLAAGLS
jgi:hypothetical protein